MTKQCTKCGETKELSGFHAYKTSKDGHKHQCKVCTAKTSRKHYLKNKDSYFKSVYKRLKEDTSGVYFIIASNGTYVGESKQIRHRVYEHKTQRLNKLSPVKKVLEVKILEVVKDDVKRKQREKYWINKLNPSLNLQYNL